LSRLSHGALNASSGISCCSAASLSSARYTRRGTTGAVALVGMVFLFMAPFNEAANKEPGCFEVVSLKGPNPLCCRGTSRMAGLWVKFKPFSVGLIGILCGSCVVGSSGGKATALAFSHGSFVSPSLSCNAASANKPQGPCRTVCHSVLSLPPPLLLRGASTLSSKRTASRRGFSLQSGSAGAEQMGDWNSGGEGESERRRYLRLARSADGASFELSTCAVTLERSLEEEVEEVELNSVIHIADGGGYYSILQERLDTCDRVLYELVATPHRFSRSV